MDPFTSLAVTATLLSVTSNLPVYTHLTSQTAPEQKLRAIRAYEVPCLVNGVPVMAFPDTGSSLDAMSEAFALRLELRIIRTKGRRFRLPNGQEARTVGYVDVSFHFKDEAQCHERVFHVLPQSSEDVILGENFLQATETLTVHMQRIHERTRLCLTSGSRIWLLADPDDDPGTVRRRLLLCTINGLKALALPDTGSDLMLISSEFARRGGLSICSDLRKLVHLADGSTAWTEGMVMDVELGFDIPPHMMLSGGFIDFDLKAYTSRVERLALALARSSTSTKSTNLILVQNLHVMNNLPHDVILSARFIFDHQIYTKFCGQFITQKLDNTGFEDIFQVKATEDSWRHKCKCLLRIQNKSRNSHASKVKPPTLEQLVEDEIHRRESNERLIRTLPEPQRSQNMDQERKRQSEWDTNHLPGSSSASTGTSSAPPMSTTTSL